MITGQPYINVGSGDLIIVAVFTCKTEEDPMKNKGARVATTFVLFKVYGEFSRRSRSANSVDSCHCYLQE